MDTIQADSLNRMFTQVRKINVEHIINNTLPENFVWVDVGSKFAKMARLLCQITEISTSTFVGYDKEKDETEVIKRVKSLLMERL